MKIVKLYIYFLLFNNKNSKNDFNFVPNSLNLMKVKKLEDLNSKELQSTTY